MKGLYKMILENGIIYSEKATVDGTEGYMIQQEGEPEPTFMPMYIVEDEMLYELNPAQGLYYGQMEYTTDEDEKKLLEEEVGLFGQKWQKFMEENYLGDVALLKLKCRWEIISRQIDKEAQEMYSQMKMQYMTKNPANTNKQTELHKYYETMDFYIKHEIMEQIVLQPRTA